MRTTTIRGTIFCVCDFTGCETSFECDEDRWLYCHTGWGEFLDHFADHARIDLCHEHRKLIRPKKKSNPNG